VAERAPAQSCSKNPRNTPYGRATDLLGIFNLSVISAAQHQANEFGQRADRQFLLSGWRKRAWPCPAADRLTLLRRATFDLTGLPPTPKETDDFLADRFSGSILQSC